MATKIFLNNVWQDYDYEYLYNNLGVTRTKSKNIVAYDSSMNEISGWYNSGYNWIIRDNQWYSSDTTPYFVKQNSSVSFYRIDKEIIFPVYKKNDEEFILKDGAFINSQSLLDDYGYTNTPSTVWDIDNAIPWSWYNSDLNEYWDDREGYKNWSPDPPDVSCPIPEEDMIFTGTDTLIMYDDEMILIADDVLAFKADGTTEMCERDLLGLFKIASIGNSWLTEQELNDAGWYVRWRIYSTTNSNGINIRDGASIVGTNTIAYYSTSQHPIGNPFLVNVDPNDSQYSMQQIKFTTDDGSTIQTGWTVCVGNSYVTYTEEFSKTDVSQVSVQT